jgi:hypothetical protein
MNHFQWSLTEIENMMPFEYEIYTSLLQQFLEEEKNKNKE